MGGISDLGVVGVGGGAWKGGGGIKSGRQM